MSSSSSSPPSASAAALSVALFGIGRAGTIHARALLTLPRCRLACVVDADVSAARHRLSTVIGAPHVTVIDSSDDAAVRAAVWENAAVGAVVVCSPTYAHEETVMRALASGKAVFCEKPLSMTTEGTQRCFAAAAAASRPLFVAFQRRFDPTFAAAKRSVDAGSLGAVEVIKSCSRDNPVPSVAYLKISGGMFHDCIIHDVDMILWQLGFQRPHRVFSQAHAFRPQVRDIGDVDTVSVQIQFESGALGIIDVSRVAAYGYDQRLEIFGSKGMAEVGNRTSHAMRLSSAAGVTTDVGCYSFDTRYAEAYRAEMQHFVDAVLDSKPLLVQPEQVMLALQLVNAAEHSYRTGQPVLFDEFLRHHAHPAAATATASGDASKCPFHRSKL